MILRGALVKFQNCAQIGKLGLVTRGAEHKVYRERFGPGSGLYWVFVDGHEQCFTGRQIYEVSNANR